MASTGSHILFTNSNFLFLLYLPILKVSCVYLEWLKSLNFEGPIEGTSILVRQLLSFLDICSS